MAPTCSMQSVLPIAQLPLGLTTPTMSTTRACCVILRAIAATGPFPKIVLLVSIPRERRTFCWRCAGRFVPKAITRVLQGEGARFVLLISAVGRVDWIPILLSPIVHHAYTALFSSVATPPVSPPAIPVSSRILGTIVARLATLTVPRAMGLPALPASLVPAWPICWLIVLAGIVWRPVRRWATRKWARFVRPATRLVALATELLHRSVHHAKADTICTVDTAGIFVLRVRTPTRLLWVVWVVTLLAVTVSMERAAAALLALLDGFFIILPVILPARLEWRPISGMFASK